MNEPSYSEADLLFSMVRARYGVRLTPEELDQVRKEVERIAENAEALRAVKLDDGDEPFSIFTPYRKEG